MIHLSVPYVLLFNNGLKDVQGPCMQGYYCPEGMSQLLDDSSQCTLCTAVVIMNLQMCRAHVFKVIIALKVSISSITQLDDLSQWTPCTAGFPMGSIFFH